MSQYSILAASDQKEIRELIRDASEREGLQSILCGDGEEALESAKKNAESKKLKLVILEAFLPKLDGFEVVNKLHDFKETMDIPVLMLVGQNMAQPAQYHSGGIQPQSLPTKIRLRADNYLQKPFEPSEIRAEIHSMIKHFRAHNAPHPVTNLLGHPFIEQEVFSRLNKGEKFSLLWIDINHFRPFNDHYGMDRGNEVLKMTVALIQKVLQSLNLEDSEKPFLAHVDGDDFILILPEQKADQLKQELRDQFQEQILKFYSQEERKKGFFYEKGRDQKDQIFPIMNLSMIVHKVTIENFIHYGHLVSICNGLLHQTKIGAQDVK
jgi:PleD family two-component response regulator